MKVKLLIVLLVFANLIITPTAVMLVNQDADISFVFSINEEENSEKVSTASEYMIDKDLSLVFRVLEAYDQVKMPYFLTFKTIHQKIVSPPPDVRRIIHV
ncbi:MAG: hypothetical protein ABR595_03440 [Psychroflexus sp.]